MIKEKLAYADGCLNEIRFLIDRNGLDLQLIDRSLYWVDKYGVESGGSVAMSTVHQMVRNGILEKCPSNELLVATPVYLLAIGHDPRDFHKSSADLETPDGDYLFQAEITAMGVWGGWSGYTKVWCL